MTEGCGITILQGKVVFIMTKGVQIVLEFSSNWSQGFIYSYIADWDYVTDETDGHCKRRGGQRYFSHLLIVCHHLYF